MQRLPLFMFFMIFIKNGLYWVDSLSWRMLTCAGNAGPLLTGGRNCGYPYTRLQAQCRLP